MATRRFGRMQVEELEPRLALSIDVSFYDFNQTPTDDNELDVETVFAVANNKLYYTGVDREYGHELFQLNLSTMVARIIDINPGVADSITLSNPQFFRHGDRLFFPADDAVHGRAVRWIDTSLSYPVVHTLDVTEGFGGGSDFRFASHGSKVFFVADDDTDSAKLHWVDTAGNIDEWQTIEEVSRVGDKRGLAVAGDKLFFDAYDASIGVELRWIDLTESSLTVNSIDLTPGSNGSFPYPQLSSQISEIVVAGDRLFFAAEDPQSGYELRWLDAGLPAPEIETIEHSAGDAPQNVSLTVIGSQVFFPFGSSISWFDAGTPDVVRAVWFGSLGDNPEIEVLGNSLFVVATDAFGTELKWLEAGTNTPIVNRVDVVAGSASSNPSRLTAANDRLYFSAIDDQLHWLEIAEGLTIVDQLESSVVTKVASDPTPAGDRVFFVAEDDVEKQVSLKWVDRQQEDPVARVIDEFAWSTEDSHVAEFGSVTKAAGKVFGLTYEGLSSDFGTLKLVDEQTGLAGEHVVDTIPRSFSSPGLFQISALNDLVFYIRSGRLKWFDASTEAPFQVNDIGFLHIDATLAKVGDRLYYDSPSGNWGWFDEDFSLGGVSKTVPGIFNVGDGGFFPVGDKLFFSGFDAQYGQELRWIDVTLDTPVVHTIDVNAGAASSDAGEVGGFALAGDKLYFTAIDSAHGSELRWVDVNSDAPTVHTVDIAPGPIGSYAGDNGNLHVAENKLFFTVHDGADDQIVWLDTSVSSPIVHSLNAIIPWQVSGGNAFASAGGRLFIVGTQLRWLNLDDTGMVHSMQVGCTDADPNSTGTNVGRHGGLLESEGTVFFATQESNNGSYSTAINWIEAGRPEVTLNQQRVSIRISTRFVPPSCESGSIEYVIYSQVDNEYLFHADRVGFGHELVSVSVSAAPGPDLNQDGKVDVDDIDLMQAAIASSSYVPAYDVNVDGELNLDDRNEWLQLARDVNLGPGPAYLEGDANLDGSVNGIDFVIWNNHKFTSSSRWSEGDFDASGAVNGIDFVFWNNTKFQSIDSVGDVVVEEPADLEPVSAGETPIALPQFEPSRPNINNYPAGKQPSSFRLANSVRRANEANSASRQALVNLDDVWAFLGSDDQDSRELLSQELKSANRSAGR